MSTSLAHLQVRIRTLIIDEYRKQKELSLDALLEQEGVNEGSFEELSESSVEALGATIDGKQALDLISILPDIYKEVLILRFVDGLGPREISVLTEESENVISVRIYRGLKMLRNKIEEETAIREEGRILPKNK